jgi:hypothetical protein
MIPGYDEITGRNLGFVTAAEQERLRQSTAFVCGVGGMGGACALTLARAGVGRLILADIDRFEASNLNRQVFATLDTLGQPKAAAAADALARIAPHLGIEVLGADWTDQAERLIGAAGVVVNGTDDLGASLLLYRTARARGRTVIDAYAAPLPSVYVTRASDPPHETRLSLGTEGTAWDAVTPAQRRAALMAEALHVVMQSSSLRHVDLDRVAQVVAGQAPRMSFAPMVILTGQLMAWEALNALMGRPHGTDNRGWFLNPHRARAERPWPRPVAALLRPVVLALLRRRLG